MSNKAIDIVMMIDPVAKARARVVFKDGRVSAFTPQETKMAELEIKLTIRQHLLHTLDFSGPSPYFDAKTPLRLEADFIIPRPPTIPKSRTLPMVRPDCDNYTKTLLDALNKFLYPDDGQITTLIVRKRYGLMPAIHLKVSPDKYP
jgi:Holliday junction resolvase RusA-like endonuclease